jgi:hypothetical protein
VSASERAAILRRRAFFVGSALTALTACPQQQQQSSGAPVVGVEPAPAGSQPESPAQPTSQPAAKPAKMPSIEIPDGVGKVAHAHYEGLVGQVKRIHAELDAANQALDDACDITDPQCDATWQLVAKHLVRAEDMTQDLEPLCPGSSDEAKAFEARVAEHSAFIEGRREALKKRLQVLLQKGSARDRWAAHRAEAAVPRPCLDYSCDDW